VFPLEEARSARLAPSNALSGRDGERGEEAVPPRNRLVGKAGHLLEQVDIGNQRLRAYEHDALPGTIEALVALAEPIRGLRVLHVNATPYGGGVAEILRSEVPLLRDLGLVADWNIISGDDEFFAVTKTVHNALQGADRTLNKHERAEYLEHAATNAALLEGDYDVIVVHDPQPLPIPATRGRGNARWVWRCHIDTSAANPETWAFLRPFVTVYDTAIFTLGNFVPPDFPLEQLAIVPPAIDPQSPKNVELPLPLATRVLDWIGVEVDRPLIVQISRFDPWKDPLGVITAYQLVKQETPDVQLVLAGSMALDDPEGWQIYRTVRDVARTDPDIHVFTNLTGVGNIEVNALQRCADVVIQKSIREGFGLVVSEALWKGTPVVAGHAGGIPLQLRDGAGGFLTQSSAECANRVNELLADAELRRSLGSSGRDVVRNRFLLTRLVADELRLYASLVDKPLMSGPVGISGLEGEPRDPVCGMYLDAQTRHREVHETQTYSFCSQTCAMEFRREPGRFTHVDIAGPGHAVS
jgi:trehalose synthase